MKSLIECVLFCGRQYIGSHGHREINNFIEYDGSKSQIDKC